MKVTTLLLGAMCLFPSLSSHADLKLGFGIDDAQGLKFSLRTDGHQYGLKAGYSKYEATGQGYNHHQNSKDLEVSYRYIRPLKDKINSFYEVDFGISFIDMPDPYIGETGDSNDSKSYSGGLYYGLEYLLTDNLAIDAKVGVKHRRHSENYVKTNLTQLFDTGLSINYYW